MSALRARSLVLLLLTLGIQACPTPEPGADGGAESDAGAVDGGVQDAGGDDGGSVDAGLDDGGTLDAGSLDGGIDDGGSDDGGIDDGGTVIPLSFDDFCQALHEALCAGFASCGCSLEGREFTLDNCVALRAGECEEQLAAMASGSLDAGVLAFDEARAARCVAQVTQIADGCGRVSNESLPQDCQLLFLSTAAIGETCTGAGPGALCADGTGVCAPGAGGASCIALPGEDEGCPGWVCQDGLVCDAVTEQCRPPLALGDACQGGGCPDGAICHDGFCRAPLEANEGPCRVPSECAAGLVCNDDSVCAAGPARGAPCGGPSCGSGDACVREYDQRACGAKLADGETCADHDECESAYCSFTSGTCGQLPGENDLCPDGACASGFACDFDQGGICVVAPGENEACLIGSAGCGPGLGCDENNVCVRPPGVGSPCLLPDNLCADGLGCDFTRDGSFCAERRGQGEACESDVCQAGLYCDFTTATCEPELAPGDACPTGGGCAEGDECGDLLGGFRCYDVPATVGAPCYGQCGGALACLGPGGVCAPEICASP